ncbi:MAG: hypothetical protein Q7T05_05785 [Dehalococcoidia bacterium]|nr:hypothetical protein [Dehalococcoidia bacterium]
MKFAAVRRKALLSLLLVFVSGLPLSPPYRAESIEGIAHLYSFDIVVWEVNGFLRLGEAKAEGQEDVRSQVSQVLAGQGLETRFGPIKLLFPPLSFRMTQLPYLLVVSPRNRIELFDTVLLDPELSAEQIVAIEAGVERLGYSAEIERVGGVALYPSMVGKGESTETALSTIAHEWFHQYLFFHPLGRGYWSSYDMTTINETVAELAGNEVGKLAYQRFYHSQDTMAEPQAEKEDPADQFDFNREMRLVRVSVDAMLAQGNVQGAELYMLDRRSYIEQQGYYIRKLNQAYFAFHGSYGNDPVAINPLQTEVRELRSQFASLGDFIKAVSGVSTPADIRRLLPGP